MSKLNDKCKKAVIYARYSSHKQGEESIEGQLRECYYHAKQQGYQVVHEYIDRGISGKTDDRPNFQQMIKDSEKHTFDVVLLYTIDRFARNRYDSAVYKAKLKRNGVKIEYAKQPLPDSPESIILESMLEGYAEYYSENLSRNVKRGMHEMALQAKSSGGGKPFGYDIDESKHFVINKHDAQAVVQIYHRYLDGEPMIDIATWLNKTGYKTSKGNKFTTNSIRFILKNEKYKGTYRYDDVVIEDAIPPIIDKDTWNLVQERLVSNMRHKQRTTEDTYILTGKLFCGKCGSLMTGESGKSVNGKLYQYYACSNRKRFNACNKKAVNKSFIEELVIEYTLKNVLSDENISLIADKVMEIVNSENSGNASRDAILRHIKDVEKKIDNLLDIVSDGLGNQRTKDKIRELEHEYSSLQAALAETPEIHLPITRDHVVFWLESFADGDITDIKYRRKLVDTLVNSIYLYDNDDGEHDKLVIYYNTTADSQATIECSTLSACGSPHLARTNNPFVVRFEVNIRTVGN